METSSFSGRRAQAESWTLAALWFVLAWDASGLDLPMARLFGTAAGFSLRMNPVLFLGLHEAGRLLGWVMLLGLFLSIRWPVGVLRRLGRGERAWLASTVLLAVICVSLIKQSSQTSCPWELQAFGGGASYVSHWAAGVADGGGGRCFPAGHASAAFAWMAGWFALRASAPIAARRWLIAALVVGTVLGLAQQMRGAHFMSHTLWTAWICWSVALLSDRARQVAKWLRARVVANEVSHVAA